MAKFNSRQNTFSLSIIILILSVCLYQNSTAMDGENQKKSEAKTPIHITSDHLYINNTTQEAEFKGNVKASQENTTILSDILQIFYKKDNAQSGNLPNDEQSIHKIIATGNVKINFDNRYAEADQAVYTADNRILELTGDNCKVTSENNMISGKKIIFHRNDGRIFVESGKDQKRVEAVISSDEKGLN
ncbi:MAG: hypothetical protein C4522_20225 [Desulfobacteraceae bacterium]|nr:MAG: hypothetical protein C4522_20225 [Desulfobacteraceae bacterium]